MTVINEAPRVYITRRGGEEYALSVLVAVTYYGDIGE